MERPTISGSFLTSPDTGATSTNRNYVPYQFSVLGTGSDTLNFPYLDSFHPFMLDDVSLTAAPSATPIPAALTPFATGLAGLGMMRMRRKKTAAGLPDFRGQETPVPPGLLIAPHHSSAPCPRLGIVSEERGRQRKRPLSLCTVMFLSTAAVMHPTAAATLFRRRFHLY